MPTAGGNGSIWPPWTRNTVAQRTLTKHCKRNLVNIMKALKSASNVIRDEAGRYLEECRRRQEISTKKGNPGEYPVVAKSLFMESDLDVLERVTLSELPAPDGDFADLLLALANTTYLPIWKAAVSSLLVYQGQHHNSTAWRLSKQRTLDILEQRDTIVEFFEDIEEELRHQKADGACEGIVQKIKSLERFKAVYDSQPSPLSMGNRPPHEPVYALRSFRSRSKQTPYQVAEAYSHLESRGVRSNLFATFSITILITFIPMGFAWKQSTNIHGTKADVDFFLLFQNSAITCLGIFLAIYPTFRQRKTRARSWAQVFAGFGVLCAFAAPAIYVYTPTMWSATLAFFSTVVQVFMMMQLALIAGPTMHSTKEG